MTAPEADPIRVFSRGLNYSARRALEVNPRTIPVIRAAAARRGPEELARIVSAGITRTRPANPWPQMWFRLRREAGLLDDEQQEESR